jgi:hypothetical protein
METIFRFQRRTFIVFLVVFQSFIDSYRNQLIHFGRNLLFTATTSSPKFSSGLIDKTYHIHGDRAPFTSLKLSAFTEKNREVFVDKDSKKISRDVEEDIGYYDMANDEDEDEDDYDEEDDENGEIFDKKRKLTTNDQEWMFFDVAKINVKGGDGGDGCMAMRREFLIEFGGPCGGNGGNGGNVYLQCDSRLNTLSLLRRRVHHKGKNGKNGQGKSRHGPKGDDCIIPVDILKFPPLFCGIILGFY